MDEEDDTVVTVYTEGDLRTAVTTDNDVDTVILGADIQLTSGIAIYGGKAALTLDGRDASGTIHTLTDINSIFQASTLHVQGTSAMVLTIQNMRIVGHNYYGIPCIYEEDGLAGLVLTYQNVTYSGPQMTYHPNGLTRYVDCDITIEYPQDTSRAQEVGEVARVEMGGRVTIRHLDTNDAVFWFRGNVGETAFTLLPGAMVDIESNSYFMYAAVYTVLVWVARPVIITIGQGASMTLTTAIGISGSSTHQASSITLEAGAAFHYTQRGVNGTNPSLYLNGPLIVETGASLSMVANFVTTGALVRFTTNGGQLAFHNPHSVILYSRGVAALSFAQSIPFTLTSGQLNEWQTPTAYASAGTFNDIPLYKWHREGYGAFTLSGNVSSGGTVVTTHDFSPEELATLPNLASLALQTAGVLSMGDPALSLLPIVDDGHPIGGMADPGANVRIQYMLGEESRTLTTTAGADGSFSLNTQEPIPLDTGVLAAVNIPFLIREAEERVIPAGELLLFFAPESILFTLQPLRTAPELLLGREVPEDPVIIRDTRVYPAPWALSVQVDGPLTTPSGHILADGVVYVAGETMAVLGTEPLDIHTDPGEAAGDTTLVWQREEGILLRPLSPIWAGDRYTARLIFTVRTPP